MHQWTGPSLVQVIACRLFGAKPLPEPNAGLLSIGLLGTSFSEILIGILSFSLKKMHLQMSSAKMAAFCPGGEKLNHVSKMGCMCYCNYHHSRHRNWIGHVTLTAMARTIILVPYLLWSRCNSFEDQAPVDFIYGCPNVRLVAKTWLHDIAPG